LWLLDVATGRETKLIAPPESTIMASQTPSWTRDGRLYGLATVQPASRLRLWSGEDPAELRLVPWELPARIALGRQRSYGFDVTRQGDQAALLEVSPERLALHLRRLGPDAEPRELELPGPHVQGRGRKGIEFSPGGRYLFVSASLRAYLIDTRDDQVYPLPGEVTGSSWSPGGEILALEGARGVQLIHAPSRVVLDRFEGKRGVAWSSDGRRLYLARPRSTEVVEIPPLDQPAAPLLERARELGFLR